MLCGKTTAQLLATAPAGLAILIRRYKECMIRAIREGRIGQPVGEVEPFIVNLDFRPAEIELELADDYGRGSDAAARRAIREDCLYNLFVRYASLMLEQLIKMVEDRPAPNKKRGRDRNDEEDDTGGPDVGPAKRARHTSAAL